MEKKNGLKLVFLAVLLLAIVYGCATTGGRWQEADRQGTIEAYETFLREYPYSEYYQQARAKLTALYEKKEWNWAQQQNRIAAYEHFLAQYPKGAYASAANTKLEGLYYENAKAKDDLLTYSAFLKRYPNSVYKNSILPRVEALWFERVKNRNTVAAYEEFLKTFPNGAYASQARALAAKINQTAAEEKERRDRLAAEEKERLARKAKEEQDRVPKEWESAKAANTVTAYKEFLKRNPKSEHADKAKQYLEDRKVEGWVLKVDRKASKVTIRTSMGQQEILAFDSEVKVVKKGTPLTLRDLKEGESVMIEYNSLPGKPMSKSISVGYSVARCSCGSNCSCPLSRGCRVIRF